MPYFVTCLPGLEPLLHAELTALGLDPGPVEPGGVPLPDGPAVLYRANLESGLASAVLLRVAEFPARSLGELVRKTAAVDWAQYLVRRRPIEVRASCKKSRLYHSDAVVQRVREGIAKRLGTITEPAGDTTEPALTQSVRVRVLFDQVRLSIDTSGEPLYRRGVRLDVGKAPLRHDLARALVIASGWDRASPLLDPFCGSGTVVIEAALLARGLPPGDRREFAFEDGPLCDQMEWVAVRDAARAKARDGAGLLIHASDRDAGAVERTRANAERAGVAQNVTAVRAAVSDAPFLCDGSTPPAAGAVVTNPPYGKRLGGGPLRALYQTFGHRVAALPPGWRVAFLVADRKLGHATALKLRTAFLTDHGGLRVRAMVRRDDDPDGGPDQGADA